MRSTALTRTVAVSSTSTCLIEPSAMPSASRRSIGLMYPSRERTSSSDSWKNRRSDSSSSAARKDRWSSVTSQTATSIASSRSAPRPATRDGRPEGGAERLLVVAGEQREDLLPAEAAPVERHPRDTRLLGDPRQRGRLPAARRDRAAGAFDHALLGASRPVPSPRDDSVAQTVRQCHTARTSRGPARRRAGRAEGGHATCR